MKLEIGKTYYFNYGMLGYPDMFTIYKVISTHKNKNIIRYKSKIILTNHPAYCLGETIILSEGYIVTENSEELTKELKAELL